MHCGRASDEVEPGLQQLLLHGHPSSNRLGQRDLCQATLEKCPGLIRLNLEDSMSILVDYLGAPTQIHFQPRICRSHLRAGRPFLIVTGKL